MTAISVDRLFALFLGIRYKQIVTLKRTNISFACVWVLSEVPALCYISYYLITIWFGYIGVSSYMVISVVSYTKIFCSFRHHNVLVHTRSYRSSVESSKFTEDFAIQKGGVPCTVGAVSISCLLSTIWYIDCGGSEDIFVAYSRHQRNSNPLLYFSSTRR